MKKIDNNAVSLAGEFLVLSQLVLNGYNANMTLGHTKGVDILVSRPGTSRMYRLEVKTKYRTSPKVAHVSKTFGKILGGWVMNEKHESLIDPLLFYCFVLINATTSSFEFYVVPSAVVARYVKKEHQHWVIEARRNGKKASDTRIRLFRLGTKGNSYPIHTPLAEAYRDKWEFQHR